MLRFVVIMPRLEMLCAVWEKYAAIGDFMPRYKYLCGFLFLFRGRLLYFLCIESRQIGFDNLSSWVLVLVFVCSGSEEYAAFCGDYAAFGDVMRRLGEVCRVLSIYVEFLFCFVCDHYIS
ncbi:hypothetical protein QT711_12745 [Sporosarcina saromensis]|uniref:Uncharacterized protein n=1 Tax=Sporosarcina saromensis TaxID=359365 RepID=A0ABU4GAQ3_9BACL|nr:hypothetical protein [Sporosarcina saromensis]MDW0114057.1 hypothetical protein [Sporosarcina saromensis]